MVWAGRQNAFVPQLTIARPGPSKPLGLIPFGTWAGCGPLELDACAWVGAASGSKQFSGSTRRCKRSSKRFTLDPSGPSISVDLLLAVTPTSCRLGESPAPSSAPADA